ncbi:uncharacterized protein LOC131942326 [Physella acuta]|uniref:uncharacterized protein LOC131942326 n=1 Tax=Physella acuta TaxID=109671 RepID=UPI0027DE67DA|nr:uncharacterized protein LOC131942326 [Physella acuta]
MRTVEKTRVPGKRDHCELDKDGCASNPCLQESSCTDVAASVEELSGQSYICSTCPPGFHLGSNGQKCEDINECSQVSNQCDNNATCINIYGSFTCTCKEGYRKSGDVCVDIDECAERLHTCEQICINTAPFYTCECEPGFNKSGPLSNVCNKQNVEDLCANTQSQPCEYGCTNSSGAPQCFCQSGMKLAENGYSCEDENECNLSLCSQRCLNTVGSYSCYCFIGYRISDHDKHSCETCPGNKYGENCTSTCECRGRATRCDSVIGCVCQDNWTGTFCDQDVDECLNSTSCRHDQLCVNTDGSFKCKCLDGYTDINGMCTNIDECADVSTNGCLSQPFSICTDNPGSYTCVCQEGYFKINKYYYCQDIDECNMITDSCDHKCVNMQGSYNCECLNGWYGSNCYQDTNECDNMICPQFSFCKNTFGSYYCECNIGFQEVNGVCVACDATHYGTNCSYKCMCVMNNTNDCSDTDGTCSCKSGWTGIDCETDVNECIDTSHCGPLEDCYNTDGAVECRCKSGYENITADGGCQECNATHYGVNCLLPCNCIVSNTADCINTNGVCNCKTGWTGTLCELDVDECTNTSVCPDPHDRCYNLDGSSECRCDVGFVKHDNAAPCQACDGTHYGTNCSYKCMCVMNNTNDCSDTDGTCSCKSGWTGIDCETDVNECIDTSHCGPLEDCYNTDGAAECRCKSGYENITADGGCQECNATHYGVNCLLPCNCIVSNTADCINTNGVCNCKTGWTGTLCELDVDECTNTSVCPDPHDRCYNLDGSSECRCDVGFVKHDNAAPCQACDATHYGTNCSYKCMCVMNNTNDCSDTDGTCSCKSGWTGIDCETDVNECIDTSHCGPLEDCYNTDGAVECRCKSGYENITADGGCQECNATHYGVNCLLPCNCIVSNTADCINTNGVCNCKTGWTGTLCELDVDECTNTSVCPDPHDRCYNLDGSSECRCDVGFVKHDNAAPCQACDATHYGTNCSYKCMCVMNNTNDCSDTDGTCSCKSGWTGIDCETDVNECIDTSHCGPLEDCYNTDGAVECRCKSGYENITADGGCQECNATHYGVNCLLPCNCIVSNTADCINTNGVCNCKTGWTGTLCELDVDECTNTSVCPDPHDRCYNLDGSSECRCDVGFVKHDNAAPCQACDATHYGTNCSYKCMCVMNNTNDCSDTDGTCSCKSGWTGIDCETDVNECIDTSHCGPLEDCYNTDGAVECRCKSGYENITADGGCQECNATHYGVNCLLPCNCIVSNTADCINTNGVCNCKTGWTGTLCELDVDECTNTSVCPDPHDRCYNLDGSSECRCDVGFVKHDNAAPCQACDATHYGTNCSYKCMCVMNNTNDCSDTDGTCSCKSGWTGIDCETDVNECIDTSHCGPLEDCYNTDGAVECRCKSGYENITADGGCQECNATHYGVNCLLPCNCIVSNTADCINTNGVCNCKTGWTGTLCELDVDECTNTSVCPDPHDRCYNLDGSSECRCDVGFVKHDNAAPCQACDATHYGTNCSYKCMCVMNNTNDCSDTDGTCSCKSGWTGIDCETDVNECIDTSHCGPLEDCYNTDGAVECRCKSGYENITADGGCQECNATHYGVNCLLPCNCIVSNTADCNNTNGVCNCKTGWTGTLCELDVDECTNTSVCPDPHDRCYNLDGSSECRCDVGFVKHDNAAPCQACDATHYGTNCSYKCMCVMNNTNDCSDTDGTCSCKSGWTGIDCGTDVNECIDTSHCGPLEDCYNTDGAVECRCKPGYENITADGGCQECNATHYGVNCLLPCNCIVSNTADCINTNGVCNCKTGWTGTLCELDVDECTNTSLCPDPHDRCYNLDGSSECRCDVGFVKHDNAAPCQACDATHYGTNCSYKCMCVMNNTNDCSDTDGTCSCKSGWTGIDCGTDVNECLDTSHCGPLEDCYNTDGAAECRCKSGYENITADGGCQECNATHYGVNCLLPCNCIVSNTADCINTNGVCNCKTGWTGTLCELDVDECTNTSVCPDPHDRCYNLDGSSECRCDVGFVKHDNAAPCQACDATHYGTNCSYKCMCVMNNTNDCSDTDGTCSCKSGWTGIDCETDVNECIDTSHCGPLEDCYNTDGAVECRCKPGYENITADGGCQECNATHYGVNCLLPCNCIVSNTADCINTNGVCNCKTGWTGTLCELDVDECTNTSVCPDPHDRCYNLDGSSECRCDVGFVKHDNAAPCQACDATHYGTNCSYKCMCVMNNTNDCSDTDGTCSCKSGWTGIDCETDVNECIDTSHCGPLEDCYNTDGAVECRCKSGYENITADGGCQECNATHYGVNCLLPCNCIVSNTADCINTNGVCNCKTGWTGTLCELDVDECTNTSVCPDPHDRCYNLDGSSECRCDVGFVKHDNAAPCQACDATHYGTNCSYKCMCVMNNTNDCSDTDGTCSCKSGWTGIDCETDVNECIDTSHCGPLEDCYNTDGAVECRCKSGYENITADGGCQECNATHYGVNCLLPCNCIVSNTADCINTNGVCNCKTGWTGTLCELDVDECTNTSVCPDPHDRCYNLDGSSECRCDVGFVKHDNAAPCQACDATHYGTNCSYKCMCVMNNTNDCSDTDGTCSCKSGWTGIDCETDVNECIDTSHCGPLEDCYNTDGAVECRCKSGYENITADGGCQECNATHYGVNCLLPCNCIVSNTADCINTNGVCNCKTGWTGTLCELDVDECTNTSVCPDPHDRCYNLDGSSECRCDVGFVKHDNAAPCQACDATHYGTNCSYKCMCVMNNTNDCSDTDGTCSCKSGWTGIDCETDVNECIDTSHCGPLEDCYNTDGAVECRCKSGYENITADGGCQECNATHYGVNCLLPCNCIVSNTADCINTNGVCNCKTGWTGTLCELDVDECTNTSVCPDPHDRCYNLDGSSECRCDVGFVKHDNAAPCQACDATHYGTNCSYKCMCVMNNTNDCSDTDGTCSCKSGWTGIDCGTDVNECLDTSHCGPLEDCYNTDGAAECRCKSGYENITADGGCQECNATHYGVNCLLPCNCIVSNTADCNNTNGVCNCKTGWTGTLCELDVDECTNTSLCPDPHDRCFNLDGSSECRCEVGFVKHDIAAPCQACDATHYGTNCSYKCMCVMNNTNDCSDTDGTCSCKSGWTGIDCGTDVNECIDTSHCGPLEDCYNTDGAAECRCKPGYENITADGGCKAVSLCHNCTDSEICMVYSVNEWTCRFNDSRIYPYGRLANDKTLPKNEELATANLQIEDSMPYHQDFIRSVWVSVNGLISLEKEYSSFNPQRLPVMDKNNDQLKLLAVYWTDLDNIESDNCNVYYQMYDRYSNNPTSAAILAKANADVTAFRGTENSFNSTTIIVATWVNIPAHGSVDERASFQCIIISDGQSTYAIYIYIQGSLKLKPVSNRNVEIGWANFSLDTSLASYYSFDTVIGNTGKPGFWIFKIGENENFRMKCRSWFNSNQWELQNITEWNQNIIPACPCNVVAARNSPMWVPSSQALPEGNCFDLLPFYGELGKRCCYSMDEGSGFLNTIPQAGSLQRYNSFLFEEHIKADEDPKDWCCTKSKLCELYYTLRPASACNGSNWARGFLFGDPHIVTLDQRSFIFNGLGEYDLVKIVGNGKNNANPVFIMQGRTCRALNNKGVETSATIWCALSMRTGNGKSLRIEISLSRKLMIIYVNKRDYTKEFSNNQKFFVNENGIIIRKQNESIIASLPESIGITVTLVNELLEFSLTLDKKYQNMTTGLLGNFNGDKTDDFIFPNGTRLSDDSSEKQLYEYGKSWAINHNESLFQYGYGQNTITFSNSSFQPIFYDEQNATTKEEAEKFCNGSGNLPCIFDYIATKNEKIAESSLKSSDTFERVSISAANQAPILVMNTNRIRVFLNQTFTLTLRAFDPDGQNVTFVLMTNAAYQFVERNRRRRAQTQLTEAKISVTITNTESTFITASAKDPNSLYSSTEAVNMSVCSSCSNHGSCDETLLIATQNPYYFLETCICKIGYAGTDCETDNDGCANNPCPSLTGCVDIPASEEQVTGLSYTCTNCPDGYKLNLNKTKCEDVDECKTKPCGTNALCENTYGSFICNCPEGFRKSGKLNCNDINECSEKLDNCDQICSNNVGSFDCGCFNGFSRRNGKCEQTVTDPCKLVNKTCEYMCRNGSNGAECFCKSGYKLNANGTCEDIDECKDKICSQLCFNTNGSFICSCFNGYTLNKNDLRSCDACQGNAYGYNCNSRCQCKGRAVRCDNVKGCICRSNWKGETCEIDVDECALKPGVCPVDHKCTNTEGSYTCDCPVGFEDINGTCFNINECETRNICPQTCIDTPGSFICECRGGFLKLPNGTCKDIDECEIDKSGCQQICINVPGSSNCDCYPGYRLKDDRKTCEKDKVDPCENFYLNCSQGCTVANEKAQCFCAIGYNYTLSNNVLDCQDIDECATLKPCNGSCVNTPGSYNCSCPVGSKLQNDKKTCQECDAYHWGENCATECNCSPRGTSRCDPTQGCQCKAGWAGTWCQDDIDECSSLVPPCPETSCVNTFGSFYCQCKQGYSFENNTCKDLDECLSSPCDQICTNTQGSFQCSCYSQGFVYNGTKCYDKDECAIKGLNSCDQLCRNTEGGFACECIEGYELNVTTRNTCFLSNISQVCPTESKCNQLCVLMNKSQICSCYLGYKLINDICVDINECDYNPCVNGFCSNSNGTFSCSCSNGMKLLDDKTSCTACQHGYYGYDCAEYCSCNTTNTTPQICSAENGTCDCLTGWTGADCSTDINECNQTKNLCLDNADCINSPGSYRCVCNIGFYRSNGGCISCDANLYGQDCKKTCTCVKDNSNDCNAVNGTCTCKPGWTGSNCETYTDECLNTSYCPDIHESCINLNGSAECRCDPGYKRIDGSNCQDNSRSYSLQIKLNMKADPNIYIYNTKQFISLKKEVEDSLNKLGSDKLGKGMLPFEVTKFTEGSVIVHTAIVVDLAYTNNPDVFAYKFTENLLKSPNLTIGSNVVEVMDVLVQNRSIPGNLCDLFTNLKASCSPNENCGDNNQTISACIPQSAEGNTNLIIGLSVGIGLFILIAVTIVIILLCHYKRVSIPRDTLSRDFDHASASIFATQFATRKKMEMKIPGMHATSEEMEYNRFLHLSQASELAEDFNSENNMEQMNRDSNAKEASNFSWTKIIPLLESNTGFALKRPTFEKDPNRAFAAIDSTSGKKNE